MSTYQHLSDSLVKEVNSLRTDPSLFASRLLKETESFKSKNLKIRKFAVPVQTYEGQSAVFEAADFLNSALPAEPLVFSEGLRRAAQLHANDTGYLGILGHIGSQDSTLQTRLDIFGKWSDCIAETVEYGSVSAFESITELLVDDGAAKRPHRQILLNPRFRKIGIGIGKHSLYEIVICMVFAGDFSEKESENIRLPDELVKHDNDLADWPDSAVRMTCEVKTEEEAGRVTQKKYKHWELEDGSTLTTEEHPRS